ncbi:MAG: hypothetical protein J6Y78_14985 [Paludibacteraceae bacterium]|nr:hypothetical protein [Paludibacteraceae bacterium]
MKDFNGILQYKGKDYKLVFNLNVMEKIQEEYGSIEEWGKMTDGKGKQEPNAKAVIFGFKEMINEGIDIQNEEEGTDIPFVSLKQVGRMITDFGVKDATDKLNETVINSTQSEEKNE